ncbi:50S ribosomal L18 [Olea europaea subsp. europaea]|uniref:50S ribosomal L18 n=1 Tax=Olea europaea subsp. europaea TaxID=158383 RepID=A0A8S0PL24_OLEEU|nr:50S ribosomal L18 [Olea europaea subsp. europaea]
MALHSFTAGFKFRTCEIFGTGLCNSINVQPLNATNLIMKPLMIEAKANTRTESAKIRNRRLRKKFNGTPTKPRLSVFCSDKQLYAMLVDDQNKKCLFYGSTLQKSIREDPTCTTVQLSV